VIIVGVGNNMVKLGDAGYYKCPRCHNECPFCVMEISKKFDVFWIPVAKWDKRYYLTCTICSYGYEIQKEEINQYIKTGAGV